MQLLLIPVKATAKKPYSSDENCLHISYEAGDLEDPTVDGQSVIDFGMTVSPQLPTKKKASRSISNPACQLLSTAKLSPLRRWLKNLTRSVDATAVDVSTSWKIASSV